MLLTALQCCLPTLLLFEKAFLELSVNSTATLRSCIRFCNECLKLSYAGIFGSGLRGELLNGFTLAVLLCTKRASCIV